MELEGSLQRRIETERKAQLALQEQHKQKQLALSKAQERKQQAKHELRRKQMMPYNMLAKMVTNDGRQQMKAAHNGPSGKATITLNYPLRTSKSGQEASLVVSAEYNDILIPVFQLELVVGNIYTTSHYLTTVSEPSKQDEHTFIVNGMDYGFRFIDSSEARSRVMRGIVKPNSVVGCNSHTEYERTQIIGIINEAYEVRSAHNVNEMDRHSTDFVRANGGNSL